MTKDQFRKIQKTLKVYLNQAEKEAIDKGVDITSPEYDEVLLELKTVILKKFGITVGEYESLKENFKETAPRVVANLVSANDILGEEKVKALATSVFDEERVKTLAKSVIPKPSPPKIINQIVKEITTPQIIERREIIKEVDQSVLDETKQDVYSIQSAISSLYQDIASIPKVQLPLDFNTQWKILTSNGTADSLHTHDIRQRRGFGGIDKDTALNLLKSEGDARFLKLDQTTPQTTVGTFTFPIVHTPTINGGILANDDITIQGTTHATRTTSYVILQPSGGNVGIGTTAPSSNLEVQGTTGLRLSDTANIAHGMTAVLPTDVYGALSKWGGSTGGLMLTGMSDTNGTGGFLFRGIVGGDTPTYAPVTFRAGKKNGTGATDMAASELAMQFQDYNAVNSYMTILGSGNVGIGTTGPNQKLEVQGYTRFSNSGTPGAYVEIQPEAGAGAVTAITTANSDLRLRATSNLYLRTASTDALTINSSGNVGIGTTGPTNILSLGGNSARIFWLERHTTANTAGNTLTITAGGATSGATDKSGGNLLLQGGLSTGTGESGVSIYGCVAGATGTADRTQTVAIQTLGNKIGFFAGTPIIKQSFIAYTADDESGAYSGIDNLQVGSVYAQLTDLNALRVAYENLRVAYEDLKTKMVATTLLATA